MPVQELVKKSSEYFFAFNEDAGDLRERAVLGAKGFAQLDNHAKKLEFNNLGS